jgi:trigger factor
VDELLMKVEVEEISPTRRRIAVEIPAERVTSEFERAFQGVARRARIPGFRPGRVPRPVLERYFGEEVRSEVATNLVREGFSSAVSESRLEVVSQPELDIGALRRDEALCFSATVDVLPPVGVIDTTGFTAERPMVAVGDEQVDQVLEQIRLRHAELVPITDRKGPDARRLRVGRDRCRERGRAVARAVGRDGERRDRRRQPSRRGRRATRARARR